MDKLIMSRKEREQLSVFKKLETKEITKKIAAQMLKITEKWVREKFKRYLAEGDKGLIHKARGRPSNKKWAPEKTSFVLELLKADWQGFGPTFVAEKLEELHGMKISSETLRKLMKAHGLEYATRKKGKQRKRRERKEIFGLMVQLDGSPHDWFEGRGPKCTLLVFIDDATSQILWLEFVKSESVLAVMKATKHYFEKHGKPVEFYVDYGSVFHVNTNNKEHEKKSQFERAMKEVNVEIIHARSPQAKGRVERCNRTMQDRLIKEMRLAKISNIDDANKFLQESNFIQKHNQKYAEQAAKSGDAHCSIEEYNLNNILCIKYTRKIMNDYTVSFQNKILQLICHKAVLIRPKDQVAIYEHLDGTLSILARNKPVQFELVGQRKRSKLSAIEEVQIENELENNEINFDDQPENLNLNQNPLNEPRTGLNQLEKAYKDALAFQAYGK